MNPATSMTPRQLVQLMTTYGKRLHKGHYTPEEVDAIESVFLALADRVDLNGDAILEEIHGASDLLEDDFDEPETHTPAPVTAPMLDTLGDRIRDMRERVARKAVRT